MTREEAIRWLEDIHRRFNPTRENLENEGGDVHLQALDMAIEALSSDRPTKHTLPDGTEVPIDEESYEIGYTEGQMADRPTGECRTCGRNADNGGVHEDGRTKCPIQEHYALLLDGYCHLYEPYKGGDTE